MPSEVDICNMGILQVGSKENRITSLTEDSDNARLCNQFYAPVRDAVLRAHPWNCAIERRTLTELTTAPISGYDHQYQLPANPWCLRILQVGDSEDYPQIIWRIEGRKLLSDGGTSIKIVYIKRITDTNEFDPLLVDAIALKLAIKLAMPMTSNPQIKAELIKELEVISLPEARTIDGQESSGDEMETTSYEDARR